MTYYAVINGNQEGPFTEEELRLKIGSAVDAQTLIWKDGMANWAPLGEVFPLSPAVPSTPGMPYSAQPGTTSSSLEPAPLLSRFLAALVDLGPMFLIGLIAGVAIPFTAAAKPGGATPDAPSAIFIVIILVLVVLALAVVAVQLYMLAKFSQTIGKWVLKIRIYDVETGQPANWVKTILMRMFVNGLIGSIPFIGGIYALVDILFIFREDRRCIHDLIAGTVVRAVPPK